MKPLCIYHGNCADGFGAAWVVRAAKGHENVEFYPGVYGQEPPDVTGRAVILVDFSYKRPVLLEMAKKASVITILDHHATAKDELVDLPQNVLCSFDMERSGAMIAWQYYFPQLVPPPLLDHIQDRDLWRFALRGTREIQAALFSYPYDFEIWDRLMDRSVDELYVEGVAIERKHHKDVAELVGVTRREMTIGGHKVPVANIPHTLTSDAGHLMGVDKPFAACYWDTPHGRVFSLRSADTGIDVSTIAASYGGGGHKHAAGFTMPIGWEGEAA